MGEGAKKTIVAVVLAAGRSSRMGRSKQLEPVDGVPMVVRAVSVALQSSADAVVVVTGAYADEVRDVLAKVLAEHPTRLSLLHNLEWASGQASSVCTAVEHFGAGADALLFLPVDQPFLPATLLQQLINVWQQGASLVAPTVDGKVRGAPALFDQSLFPQLLELTGDVGARPLLQRYREQLYTVPAQATWLRDIDTPEDLDQTSSPTAS